MRSLPCRESPSATSVLCASNAGPPVRGARGREGVWNLAVLFWGCPALGNVEATGSAGRGV